MFAGRNIVHSVGMKTWM
jgi:hypothetical protein